MVAGGQWSVVSVGAALRRPPKKILRCAQDDRLAESKRCHPERSEGSFYFRAYYAFFLLRRNCIATPSAITPRPMKSVSVPGMISARPPPISSMRSNTFMFVIR